jgi:FMN phosphatase YigB (HAD superfamily)
VTGSSVVWAQKALEYMQIRSLFDIVLTVEDFVSSKKEAFTKISHSSGIPFENLISIGDQMHSDIIPAKELSMQTLHVR